MRHAVLLLAIVTGTASAQSVRVIDDQRAEVVGILFRIAGASDFATAGVQPYIRQVDSAFLPFRNHPVFGELNRLRKAYGIALSDIPSLAPQLTDPVTFGERAPLDAPSSTLARSWHGAEARPFLAMARDFARVARVADFLRAHNAVYDSATARMQRLVNTQSHLEWFTGFFAEPTRDVLIVSPLLATSRGNFGADFHTDSTHERYAFLAVPGSDSGGSPTLSPETLPTLIHELNHSYVNHVLDSVRVQLAPAGERIFPVVRDQMTRLAYSSPQVLFNESVVRAGVIRYLRATDGPDAARSEMQLQRGLGFVWMDELVDLLGDYEANRTRYPTFSAFAPRVVSYYDALAKRITSVRAAYDGHRPLIIKTSIANRGAAVDPAVQELVLTFSMPVSTSIVFKGNFGGGIPELTGSSFDATRTVLTIGVRLVPGKDYSIPFGPGFISDDGYPNQPLDLTFRTKGNLSGSRE